MAYRHNTARCISLRDSVTNPQSLLQSTISCHASNARMRDKTKKRGENTMRDLERKIREMDEPGDYRVIMVLPNIRKAKAVIRCAEDADVPCLWQVVTEYTTLHFRTMRKATDYCRQRGWL